MCFSVHDILRTSWTEVFFFEAGETSLNWVRSCHKIDIYLCVSSQAEQTKKHDKKSNFVPFFKKRRRELTDRQTCCTAGWGVIKGKWFVYSHMMVGYIRDIVIRARTYKGLDGLCFLVWYFWHGAPTFIKVSVACWGFYSKLGFVFFCSTFLTFVSRYLQPPGPHLWSRKSWLCPGSGGGTR